MRKTLATIVLTLGLVLTLAPVSAGAATDDEPCTKNCTPPCPKNLPCVPECGVTFDAMVVTISNLAARENANLAKLARKNARIERQAHRIHVLTRKLARAESQRLG